MKRHELKTHPAPFAAMRDGLKPFEFRKDDRGYEVGDVLMLREWAPHAGTTGTEVGGHYTDAPPLERVVTYILRDSFGVPPGYCVMGVRPVEHRTVKIDGGIFYCACGWNSGLLANTGGPSQPEASARQCDGDNCTRKAGHDGPCSLFGEASARPSSARCRCRGDGHVPSCKFFGMVVVDPTRPSGEPSSGERTLCDWADECDAGCADEREGKRARCLYACSRAGDDGKAGR